MSSVLRKTRGSTPSASGDEAPVERDLVGELVARREPRERVVRRLGEELDASGRGEPPECLERLGRPRRAAARGRCPRARRRPRNADAARGGARRGRSAGTVAARCDGGEHVAVGLVVEVAVLAPDVEVVVAAQPVRLMDLEIETDRDHGALARILPPIPGRPRRSAAAASRQERRADLRATARGEGAAQRLEGEDREDLGGEVLDVAEVDAQDVPDDLRDAGGPRDDDRGPVLERLERRQAERLGDGRHHEDVGARVQAVELVRRAGSPVKRNRVREAARPRRARSWRTRRSPAPATTNGTSGRSRGDARRRLDEVLGPLLPRDPAGEEDDGRPGRGRSSGPGSPRGSIALWTTRRRSRGDAVLAGERRRRCIARRRPRDRPRRGRTRSIVGDEPLPAAPARSNSVAWTWTTSGRRSTRRASTPGEERQPVVRVDDVERARARRSGRPRPA